MKCSSFRGPGTWPRLLAWSGKSLEELPRLALFTAAVVELVVLSREFWVVLYYYVSWFWSEFEMLSFVAGSFILTQICIAGLFSLEWSSNFVDASVALPFAEPQIPQFYGGLS